MRLEPNPTLLRIVASILPLAAAGCFIPGGGWTMRAGVDWRSLKKPGVYMELVDTRWDENHRAQHPEPHHFGGGMVGGCPSLVTPFAYDDCGRLIETPVAAPTTHTTMLTTGFLATPITSIRDPITSGGPSMPRS
jgi:hypothetical protein